MQQKRKDRLPWTIVLLVVVISCAAALGLALLFRNLRSSSDFADYTAVELENAVSVQTVSDGIVYYDGNAITKVGTDARTKWSCMVGANDGFSATEDGVASWYGRKLTLINANTGVTEYSSSMDSEVLSAAIGAKYTAVLLGPEHDSTIVLMEIGGRKVDSITLSDQTVIDYGFFANDTLFWIMALDTNGTAPSCMVNTYRPGRRMVGSISDSEQLLYHVTFQSTQICVAGETHLKVYNYSGEEQVKNRRQVYGWTLVDSDDNSDNPMMAFTLNGEFDSTELISDVRMIRGNREQIVRMPFGAAKLVADGDKVYGFSEEGYLMVAQMGRQKVDAYRLPVFFDTVYGVINNNTAVLGSGTTIYLVSMN